MMRIIFLWLIIYTPFAVLGQNSAGGRIVIPDINFLTDKSYDAFNKKVEQIERFDHYLNNLDFQKVNHWNDQKLNIFNNDLNVFEIQGIYEDPLRWPKGEVNVCFLHNSSSLKRNTEIAYRVIKIAQEWNNDNIRFKLGNVQDLKSCDQCSQCQVRVTFDVSRIAGTNPDLFSNHAVKFDWSAIGKEAVKVRFPNNVAVKETPTMLLDSLPFEKDSSMFRHRILHEFGHALGMLHEYNFPISNACSIDSLSLFKNILDKLPINDKAKKLLARNYLPAEHNGRHMYTLDGYDSQSVMRYCNLDSRYYKQDAPSSCYEFPIPDHLSAKEQVVIANSYTTKPPGVGPWMYKPETYRETLFKRLTAISNNKKFKEYIQSLLDKPYYQPITTFKSKKDIIISNRNVNNH